MSLKDELTWSGKTKLLFGVLIVAIIGFGIAFALWPEGAISAPLASISLMAILRILASGVVCLVTLSIVFSALF